MSETVMSSAGDRVAELRRKYGNWWPTRRATLGGLTLPGWAVFIGAVLAAMFLFMLGVWQVGLLVLLLAVLFELLFVVRFGDRASGQTVAERFGVAWSFAGRVHRGEARFNTGLFSNLPADQQTPLPGVLSRLEEFSGTDGHGRPFTLLYHPEPRVLTAVFECNPDGRALQSQLSVDGAVGWYSEWLSSLSADPAIVGATATDDSALTSSAPLVARKEAEIDPGAPEVAQRATREGARALPGRHAEISVWVTVSWSVTALADSLEDAVTEVAARLPVHIDALRHAGGGLVTPATSEMLARAVRIAYNPARAAEYAADLTRGHREGLKVTQAGPEYFDDSVGRVCLHDGVASMTALVLAPPRQRITEQRFETLFAPTDRFLRKRVTVFYRPLSFGKSQRMVEAMSDQAELLQSAKRRPRHDDKRRVDHARKAEAEIGDRGAAMVHFGMAVTVTFDVDKRSYREAELQLKTLLERSSVAYRFCDADAGPAFHATLPLGMLPWQYETAVERYLGGAA